MTDAEKARGRKILTKRKTFLISLFILASLILASYFTLAPLDMLHRPTPTSSSSLTSSLLPISSSSPTPSPSTNRQATESPSVSVSPNATLIEVPSTSEPSPTFSSPNSTVSIIRDANTPEETRALQAAEDFDYANASDAALYGGQYANFINTDVINYYVRRANSSEETMNFNYHASSDSWSQVRVTITSNSIQVTGPSKGTISVSKSGWGTATFAYLNDSQYQSVKEGTVNLDLPTCYVVKMDLIMSQVFGPTNGFWNTINQIVVLDYNFRTIAFGVQSQQVFS
jgi:hypothetical protein